MKRRECIKRHASLKFRRGSINPLCAMREPLLSRLSAFNQQYRHY
jgi:hypothetical protein